MADRPLQKEVLGFDKNFAFEKHLRGNIEVDGMKVSANTFYRDMLDGLADVLKRLYGDNEKSFVGESLETIWFHSLYGFAPLTKHLSKRPSGTPKPSATDVELARWAFAYYTVAQRNRRLDLEGLLDD